jgi:DTW domain-containing protein
LSRRHKPHLRCNACRLHTSVCICGLLPRIDTRTHVVLVVHQLEARKPTNTGLLAARCLQNATVAYRGRSLSDDAPGLTDGGALVPPGARPLILYPHDGALPIEAFRQSPTPLALIVPDGTWRQAARTRTRVAALLGDEAAAPCVTVGPAAPSVPRRLRLGARPERLATLEALALALGVLEGPEVEAELLHVFRVMTERTLWTNGRVAADAVTGGIPPDARPHDPLGRRRIRGAS